MKYLPYTVIAVCVFIATTNAVGLSKGIEIASQIAQVVLVIVAILALNQIRVAQDQNKDSRLSETVKILEKFQDVIQEYDTVFKKRASAIGYLSREIEMEEYTFEEMIKPENLIIARDYASKDIFYKSQHSIFTEITNCMNKLEVIAFALQKGPTEKSALESIISNTFCGFVEREYFIYIFHRKISSTYYEHTIALYKEFKPLIKTNAEQGKSIAEYDRTLQEVINPIQISTPTHQIDNVVSKVELQ